MNLAPVLRQRFLDSNGLPLSGGKLYSYAAGTTTPLATYSNATGTTNANPVVLDSSGYADVFLDPTQAYKFKLTDSAANVLWTVDNVTYAVGVTAWNANSVYSQGNLVMDTSGYGLLYVSLINSNQNQPLTNASAWRMFSGNVRTVTANTTLAVSDDLVRSNSATGNLTHTLPACASTPIGKRITVKDTGSGTYSTSLKGNGTETIDGSNTYGSSIVRYAQVTVENNGSTWDVVAASTSQFTGLTTANLSASAGILGSQLSASAGITGSQLSASAGIAGSQLASNTDLPGNSVTENTKKLVVSNTNASTSLAIVRGHVTGGVSPTIRTGEGFTTAYGGATGQYTVTFSSAFASTPSVVVCAATGSSEATATLITPLPTTTGFAVKLTTGGVAFDTDFAFIAIGPRA